MQQSGGAVFVQSSPGEGSTFSVYLPAANVPADAVPQATTPRARSVGGARVVFLVEDDASVSLGRPSVVSRRYCLREAGSGEGVKTSWCSIQQRSTCGVTAPGAWSRRCRLLSSAAARSRCDEHNVVAAMAQASFARTARRAPPGAGVSHPADRPKYAPILKWAPAAVQSNGRSADVPESGARARRAPRRWGRERAPSLGCGPLCSGAGLVLPDLNGHFV